MKTLKFEHELAQEVLAGTKTSTWRMNDLQALSVNDDIEFIDKVDAERPDTWLAIGQARITQITEKRLGDITDKEMQDKAFGSYDEMLATFRRFNGVQVNDETPVKIVSFRFDPYNKATVAATNIGWHARIKLYADGGSRGNPGPSASGYVLLDMNDAVIKESGVYLGITTNNQAEYKALLYGLEDAAELKANEVEVYMDSLLVINQMKGIFKVKNQDLLPIHEAIKAQARQFSKVIYTHVPRALNKLADTQVNKTLDARKK